MEDGTLDEGADEIGTPLTACPLPFSAMCGVHPWGLLIFEFEFEFGFGFVVDESA